MLKIENIQVFNFTGAMRGMRNPKESWDKNDTYISGGRDQDPFIGPNDLDLAQRLIRAGSDHSKFMRQIFISMDIIAPLYWWKEMDTYKVGTTANSCSTMHKLASTPITRECFSFDFTENGKILGTDQYIVDIQDYIISKCEQLRLQYLDTKDIDTWKALIQLLPCGWNQKRTWTGDYAVARNIHFARKDHKVSEWHTLDKALLSLPYGPELIGVK